MGGLGGGGDGGGAGGGGTGGGGEGGRDGGGDGGGGEGGGGLGTGGLGGGGDGGGAGSGGSGGGGDGGLEGGDEGRGGEGGGLRGGGADGGGGDGGGGDGGGEVSCSCRKLPAGHAVQLFSPVCVVCVPGGHRFISKPSHSYPTGQVRQSSPIRHLPVGQYSPGLHGVSLLGANEPSGQTSVAPHCSVHSACPNRALKVSAGHGSGATAACAQREPGGHSMHAPRSIPPRAGLNRPAGQGVGAELPGGQ